MDFEGTYSDLKLLMMNSYDERFRELLDEADLSETDSDGDTLLHHAADLGKRDAAEALIEHGAEIDARNEYDVTPLHNALRAAEQDGAHDEITKMLLENGASVRVSDNRGQRPLHYASYSDRSPEIFELLIEHGANPNHENKAGNTVWERYKDRDDEYTEILRPAAESEPETRSEEEPTGLEAGHEAIPTEGDVSEWIEEHLIPLRGQCDTVQGELYRAVSRLRSEAMRNANINWNEHYERLVDFLEEHLADETLFSEDDVASLRSDLDRLRDSARTPVTDEEFYDRLFDKVVAFCEENPELIAKPHDDELAI